MAKAWLWMCLAVLPLASCNGDDGGGGSGDGGGGSGDGGSRQQEPASGRSGALPADGPECLAAQVSAEIAVGSIDKLDLLFVIDDSESMREEQAALREQFARLIDQLTTGMRPDGTAFPKVTTLHLGVVSTDMGLVRVQGVPGCEGLGDDGIMRNTPSPDVAGCQASYPRFLSYTADVSDPAQTANDFACVATLGTDGCRFEQPLEAALKALWPSIDVDPETGEPRPENRITFLADDDGFGRLGHGDQENQGFLRNDPQLGLSAIAVVVVTDEEDCSSLNTDHLRPAESLPDGDPLREQDPDLRCYYNPQNLYRIERYIDGLQALRPGDPHLVLFFAIAGIPADLTEPEDFAALDYDNEVERESFYDRILADPRMQEVPVPDQPPGMGALQPSCDGELGRAYPPRRIVEVARGFGANGAVYSICQPNLEHAIDGIVDRIARQLGAACLDRPLERDGSGLVPNCKVYWELPPPGAASPTTPTSCGMPGFEFLLEPEGRSEMHARGGAVCEVPQLAVRTDASGVPAAVPTEVRDTTFADGWYYDDFSEPVSSGRCSGGRTQRISFTSAAKPPTGVVVKLECLAELLAVDWKRPDLAPIPQPRVGDPCDSVLLNGQVLSGDEACVLRLASGELDRTMFCHPTQNACVIGCESDADCPEFWRCEDDAAARAETGDRAFCAPPSCSAGPESASAEHVGDRCLPASVPTWGFDGRQIYVSAPSPDCGGGPCIVAHLNGDPRRDCVSVAPDPEGRTPGRVCAAPLDIEERIYCSCRCDAPDGYATCACPSGYSCVDAIEQGSADIRGGYCVRNGTFASATEP